MFVCVRVWLNVSRNANCKPTTYLCTLCLTTIYHLHLDDIVVFFCSSFAFKIRLVVLCDFHQFFIIIINPLSFLYVYVYC